MSRGVAKKIGMNLCHWHPAGYRMRWITPYVLDHNLRGNVGQCVIDRVQLYIIESEMPESAARYYDRYKPYIPSSIDGQLADIWQGCIVGGEVIPPGYARVKTIMYPEINGQLRRIRCGCNGGKSSNFVNAAYFNNGETGDKDGKCPKCEIYQWYTIKEVS